MATILTTGLLNLPNQILDPWLGKIQLGSSVAALSNQIPMKFGPGQSMTFDIGEAEYVGEGADKGPSNIVSTTVRAVPYKFHKTVRWTDEVQWADEDTQLDVVSQILNQIQPSLSRALDYGVYHGTNPSTGQAAPTMTVFLDQTANTVSIGTSKPSEAVAAADAAVLANGYLPSSIAVDPAFAARAGTETNQLGARVNPDFIYATTPTGVLSGHTSSVSSTVGSAGRTYDAGPPERYVAAATPDLAFVGDFSAIRWGIQRQIGLELIRFGDPDGQGDLRRNNEVAFRSEVVYGWGIGSLDAFAKIVTP